MCENQSSTSDVTNVIETDGQQHFDLTLDTKPGCLLGVVPASMNMHVNDLKEWLEKQCCAALKLPVTVLETKRLPVTAMSALAAERK